MVYLLKMGIFHGELLVITRGYLYYINMVIFHGYQRVYPNDILQRNLLDAKNPRIIPLKKDRREHHLR